MGEDLGDPNVPQDQVEVVEPDKAEAEISSIVGHLSVSEWARVSGFSYRSLLTAIQKGNLVAYRPGGRYGTIYVEPEAFQQWKESIRVTVDILPDAPRDSDVRRRVAERREERDEMSEYLMQIKF